MSSAGDLMIVQRAATGERRYFRAGTAEHEEYSYRRPFILELELTRRCNLGCFHCYVDAEDRVYRDELSLAEIEALLDAAVRIGIPELSLTGGEVMLRPDLLEVIDAGLARSLHVRLVSNATLLDDRLLAELVRRPIKLVTVSLDAISPQVHDAIRGPRSHARALQSLLRLAEAGIPVSVITAFSRLNLQEFDALHAFCRAHRIPWQVQLTAAKGRCGTEHTLTPDEYYALGEKVAAAYAQRGPGPGIIPMDDLATFSHFAPLSLLARTWQGQCTGGLLNLFVRASGDVTPCSALCFQSCIVGNVRTDRLDDICAEERCRAVLAPFSRESRQGACRSCAFLDDCGGGCPEMLLSMSRSPHENDYCFHKIEQERILAELP